MGGHQSQDLLDPDPSIHQRADTGPKTTVAPQPTLSGPSQHISSPAAVLGPYLLALPYSSLAPALGHLGCLSQRSWDSGPPISRLTSASRRQGPYIQRPWDKLHPPVDGHHPVLPRSLHNFLVQPYPLGGRHRMQGNYNHAACGTESTNIKI